MGMFTEWRDDENAKLQRELAEARAEIERLKAAGSIEAILGWPFGVRIYGLP